MSIAASPPSPVPGTGVEETLGILPTRRSHARITLPAVACKASDRTLFASSATSALSSAFFPSARAA